MEKVYFVSVVRDALMYENCVLNNPNTRGCQLVRLDNAEENLPVPVRYNSFIDSIGNEDAWIVFCHEDWKVGVNLSDTVRGLSPDMLYGPIGKTFIRGRRRDYHLTVGRIHQCRKDGSGLKRFGNRPLSGIVDTFDCQCLIVHSSLIAKSGLRFDEHLKFDLYVEDFCVAARVGHNIMSKVIPIECCHYSGGTVGQAYYDGLEYLNGKYRGLDKPFACIAGNMSSIGTAIPSKKSGHVRYLADSFLKIV